MKFTKLVAEQGLYLHLRIGPYVCAEWNFGYANFLLRFFSFNSNFMTKHYVV